MKISDILALAVAVPMASAKIYFQETFDSDTLPKRWVVSESKDDYGKFAITAGKFFADKEESRGLKTMEDARFYAISAPLDVEFDNSKKDLVLQFTAKFEQDIDCGGGYIKLLPKMDPKKFNGDSPYSIMFGPDICGYDKKVHAILTYKGKNHLIKKSITPGSDEMTHEYTFILHPDQTFEILVDGESKESGSILDNWDLLPPKKIKDPEAKKPADWVDDAEMDDPEDKKPEDWVELPASIVDPDAKKPDDWDDDMDGEWEPPRISNPDYTGPWKAKQIANPGYKGPWVHPDIDNPDYAEDNSIYHSVNSFVGFDLWQVKSGTIFDNIIVTDSVEEASEFSKKHVTAFTSSEKAAKDKLDEAEKAEAAATEEKEKEMSKDGESSESSEASAEVGVDRDEL